MTPLIILISGIPIIVIIFIIIAIVRLIIRLSKSKDETGTYKPPQQNQGPYNNPTGQQGPYSNPHQNYPPYQQPQQPGGYQPPEYTQQQPTYQQPHYSEQKYTPPVITQSGTTQRRSTAIPGTYATYIDEQPKRNYTGLIFAGVIVLAVVAGGVGLFLSGKLTGAALTEADFRLAYENPTDHSYLIVLDDWDTVQVEPYTASTDIEYAYDAGKDTLHWKVIAEDGTVIADTNMLMRHVQEWYSEQLLKGYSSTPAILINPSRSEYYFWTVWYNGEGDEYAKEMKVGDSTYLLDAWITDAAFIFDERDPEYTTEIADADPYSDYEQSQFLVSIYDLPALYNRIYTPDEKFAVFSNYRTSLMNLFESSRDVILAEGRYTADDVEKVYVLDSLTPVYIDESTEPRDFLGAIEYLQQEEDLFRSTDPKRYKAVMDSSDVVLKHAYTERPRAESFPPMRYVSYYVDRGGWLKNKPSRVISYESERGTDGTLY